MALVKKPRTDSDSHHASGSTATVSPNAAREAEAQRRRARTLAKQQQASERISAATTELSAGINEASSASEELKRASDQIATGSEEASAAAQESLAALTQVTTSIARQLTSVGEAQKRANAMQEQALEVNSGVKALVDNLGLATERQADSVKMVAELERQASNMAKIKAGIKPDLMITDINMPNMDGITLIGEARKLLRFTPILALTTESQTQLRDEAKRKGATGWLVKPIGGDALLKVIKQVLPTV